MATELARFVHLHVHTEYSLLDGACRIDDAVQLAHRYRMPALAITDHGNLFGVIEFYKRAGKAGLKPIIGIETYVAAGDRRERKAAPGVADSSYHLTLLAENEQGYRNLMKLSSRAYLDGFYYKPRIDRKLLAEHGRGIVGLSGCLKGEIPQLLLRGELAEARQRAAEYRDILGRDNFYIEIQEHHLPDECRVNPELVALSKEMDIPLVATNDCHYLRQDMARSHDMLLCIQTQSRFDDSQRMRFSSEEFYFRSPQEMERLFREIPAAVRNTFEIAQRCGLTLEVGTGKAHLPTFPLPAGYDDPNRYLRELAEAGLREQYDRITPELESRLARELDIIQRMEYAGYFLIVKDFIDFAREKGIAVGPGRGSAVGSLVCYALRITDVDPLKYGLLFERFMNLERVSMPDIDIDFGDRRRDEIIEHVINKYGQENVTQIITFGTLMSRAAVRDVGRAMGIPYQDVDRLAKAIPYGKSLAEAREVAEFKEAVTGNESFEALVAVAGQIEGLLRHAGTHAAGVVITPGPLTDYLPLYRGTNDVVSTQYAMESLEDIGLLKMDFLGLRTLTVIQETERMLKERGIDLDVGHVPLDDLPTFELLRQGDTVGVFQLESSGMRELLRRLGPDSISDLIALVALYRPGPMRMTEEFVERKHGRRKVEYAHPLLEKVLKETYGVGVYQEQVMEVSSALAGFPLGKADKIRRAMAKKKPEEMERIREDFIAGAVKNKVAEPVAQKVFQLVAEFAGYGFNKSHAAAYAILSYRTAYLKAHYPREFMAATLSSEMGDTDRIIVLLSECREMDLNVLPPDVNESTRDFQVVPEGIRFGLGAVKNVGEGAIRELLQARSKLGRIATLTQLAGAVDTRTCNRKVLESLIKAGALDSLDTPGSSPAEKRAALLAMLEKVLQDVSARKRRQMLNQTSLFETETSPGPLPSSSPSETPDSRNLLSDEKEALGFYLSGHPLESFREELRAMRVTGISELEKKRDNEPVVLGGVISAVRRTRDRNGREMGFVTLDDFEGSVEVTMFADVFVSYRGLILKNSPVLIQGKVSTREGERPKVLATELVTFETCRDEFIRGLHLELSEEWPESTLMSLKDALKEHPGICSVYLHVRDRNGTPGIHSTKLRVNPSSALMERLRRIAGTTNVYLEGMWRRDSPRHPGPPRG